MLAQRDKLQYTFARLAYTQKYEVVLHIMQARKGVNTFYQSIYTYLTTSAYISESTLQYLYQHALHILEREGKKQHIVATKAFEQKHTQLKHALSTKKKETKNDENIEALLENI